MEITRERTLPPVAKQGAVVTLVIDVDNSELLEKVKQSPNLAATRNTIGVYLRRLLEEFKTRLPTSGEPVLNLNLLRLVYPLHFWEAALFKAARQVDFPCTVYITEIETADRLLYARKNRSLQSFVSHLSEDDSSSTGETTIAGEYENLLKRTIMIVMRQYGFDDQTIEGPLAETHNLEELIHYCETHGSL